MAKAGVPESWLTFPIGTLKTAGALGLLLGLIAVPLIGTAAAIGLILAIGFLSLAVAALALDLAASQVVVMGGHLS
jgi:hypothetical protein